MLGWILVFAAVVALFAEPNVGVLVAVAAAVLWYLVAGSRSEEDDREPVPPGAPDATDFPLKVGADRRLRWHETDGGSGFVVEEAETGERTPLERLDGSDGIFSVEVASGSHREGALQDASFRPGREVRLVPEPDNPVDPDAVAVWNRDETLQAGYLPQGAAEKRDLLILMRDGVPLRAFVAWQELDERGRRRGLELLVLDPDVSFTAVE